MRRIVVLVAFSAVLAVCARAIWVRSAARAEGYAIRKLRDVESDLANENVWLEVDVARGDTEMKLANRAKQLGLVGLTRTGIAGAKVPMLPALKESQTTGY